MPGEETFLSEEDQPGGAHLSVEEIAIGEETTIGFKSARARMALGIGKMGSPMAEGRVREKLRSLTSKGCLEILGTERTGTRIRLHLVRENK